MALEITGKLVQVMAEQTGTGKAGPWTKQEFVIETQDQYPRKVCFNTWNEKSGILKKVSSGEMLKVSFNAESREYNGRWFTDLRAWRIEQVLKTAGEAPPSKEQMNGGTAPAVPDIPESNDSDDLPF